MMNLVHQLLLLSLSTYLDDVTGVSSSRDVSASSDQTAIQRRRTNEKNHQLITDESEDIGYGGGGEGGDPTPHNPTSHEVSHRDTSPLSNTSYYDVTSTSPLSTTWDHDAIMTPTRADRVRRGMIRYRELESDWGDAWAHTPTLTTSEENDANGPFRFSPRTMKMPLYNTRNYMKNKAKYAELGILKSIELPESAETGERKLREDFIEEQIRKRGNKPKRHKGLDEIIMERVIKQRAAWKNGTWTRSTARTYEVYSAPPTEPTFLMTINKDLSGIDDPIETILPIVTTKKQDYEASYETSESETTESAEQQEKENDKTLKDKRDPFITKLPPISRGEKKLEVVNSAQCLPYFDIRELLRRNPHSPIRRLIAHHDLDTGGMTLAPLTTERPTFPSFSRGTYTLPPDLAMATQGMYHPDPMRSAITALLLRLYQGTAPPRGPHNEQFFAPVDFHVPVLSTPKKTFDEFEDAVEFDFFHWRPWFSPRSMVHDVFPSDVPQNVLYQRIVKYIENVRAVFMSNDKVHAFERLTLGIKRNASIWWQFKPIFHFLPITYYDTVTNYSANASIDHLVHDFYRAEPTDIRDFTRLERKVIYHYERLKNVTFAPCGMFVHQDFPWLTALPDGAVNHSQSDVMIALVPFLEASGKKMKEYVKRKLHCPIYYPHDTNSRRINDTIRFSSFHPDYKRIHINMVIANKSECDVIFYSEDEILVLRVEQNNTIFHGQYKNLLDEFYTYHLIPELVDSRAARGLPMRENTHRIKRKEAELKAKQSDNDNRFVGVVWKYDKTQTRGRKSRARKVEYQNQGKRKLSAKIKGAPSNMSVVKKKKKKRRKKRKNETEMHYYDVLSRSNEDWMKFISPEDLEKYVDHRNGFNTTATDEPFTYPPINIEKLKRKFWRRVNKTRRTTVRPIPHRLKKKTTKKITTINTEDGDKSNDVDDERYQYGSDGTVSSLDDSSHDINRESKKEILKDEYSDVITHHSLQAKMRLTETEHLENWRTGRTEHPDRITRMKNTVESRKNSKTKHNFNSKEKEREAKTIKTIPKRENKLRLDDTYSDSQENKNIVSREKNFISDSTRKRKDKYSGSSRNRRRRRPRAVDDDQLSSSDDSSDSEDLSTKSSPIKNTNDRKERKNRNFNANNEQRKITSRKTKKQRTLSIQEAKQRRVDKKMKVKTTRAADPEIIAQQKKELKKVLQIPSDELDQDELIAKPNISTVYAVDPGNIENIKNLLGSINGSENEKLFLDLMNDLEETGTVQNKLYRDIEIEKSKIKLSTLETTKELTTRLNTVEQKTLSQTSTMKTLTTLAVKTKRTKAKTTFPLYVDGYDFSAERKTTISQKQTKKVLRYTSTTRKKSIHEIMGITRKPLPSDEVLNTQENKEFLHDVYFDYGNKRGPVQLDILVTPTIKPKIKTSHLKIERLITTDINEIENIKMKRKNFDLQHMLGSHADYYDNMKKIMEEKTIGKDTQEHLMEEILIEKHAKLLTDKYKEVETPENVKNEQETEKNTIHFTHTRPTSIHTKREESGATSTAQCTSDKFTEYYFPADNPIFNIPLPDVNVSHPRKSEIEDEIEKYNRQLMGEQEEASQKLKSEVTDDTSTMEQNSHYQKILEHYLVSEKSGQNPISNYIKQNMKVKSKIETQTSSKNVTEKQTEQEKSVIIETKEDNKDPQEKLQKADIHSFLQNQLLKSSTPTILKKSEENSEDIVNKKLREEIMKNAHPGFEEVKLSHENEEDESLSNELNKYSQQKDKKQKLMMDNTTKASPKITKKTTNLKIKKETVEYTSLATLGSKELEAMMKNKDAHFEKILGDYMKQHTEQTRREILRGRSTKIYSSTTPRSKDIEWETTKNHCPAFLNQTMFDDECQKFIRIINKRGDTQLQRLEFEMKTKNNPMIGKVLSLNLLTANNFADVVKRTIKKPCDLASEILYRQVVPHVLDPQAVAKYKDLTGSIISKCGYFIDDKYPFLAVGPDGLIDDEGMVKFINTSTYPNVNMRMLFLRDKHLRSNFIVDKNISLSPEGSLMYEIQGALHVTKRQFCDLFVYNGNDHLLLKVQRKKDFWKSHMRKPLIDFYRHHMLPAIVKRILHRRYKISPEENYLLNSEEDLLSVIRGLKSDTTQQTLPIRPTEATKMVPTQVNSQEKIFDSHKFEEEEWENLQRKTVQIPILGRTRSINKEKLIRRKEDLKQSDSGERSKILKNNRDSKSRRKTQKYQSETENSRENSNENGKREILVKDKIHRKNERKSSISRENKRRDKYASLESLYESQEQRKKQIEKIKKKTASLSTEKKRMKYISKSDLNDESARTRKHKKEYKDSSVEISSHGRKDKKIKRKHTSREINKKKYNVNKEHIARELQLQKNKKLGIKNIVQSSETLSDSSHETSEDSERERKRRKLKFKTKIRTKVQSSDISESYSKSEIQKRKKKRKIREVQEVRENVIRGRRIRRDYVALPEKEQTSSGDRVTIENLYSYKDTEYSPDSYDPNESVFRSLPNHVAKKKAEPDFLVDFYKKGLISKDEFLEIVKNKTREGKQWRRMPSVESSKTFETENYSDLVKLIKKEPLSGIKASVTEDPVEYDKDDVCKKYMRNIGYGRPMDETLFNKSIVFTADDIKRIKQEKLEAKFARAKAKRKIQKRKNKKVDKSSGKTEEAKKKKLSKIKGKRIGNETLSVADLSLGDEDSDEVTKQKGRWKTSPRFDMYNKSQRAERRRGFRRQYRLYWENLSKLKRLYPSVESENPDEKLSDRFYRGLKVAGVKTMSWEYTSMRECFHSYSTEFREERKKRKELLKRVYADENTAEILQRLGRRLARKKQLGKNKTQSQDKLLEVVKEELIKRIPRNATKVQVVKSVRRRKRSASMEMDLSQSLTDESGDSNTTELQQESIETALKKAQKGEDYIPTGRATFTYTTRKEDRDFNREKKRRAKLLKLRPKYADRSSSSIEFILLQKELKKHGDNFSYLSVSITVEGMTEEKEIPEDPKSRYYITKPMGTTLNDQDALLNILKEKSEEDKLVNKSDENVGASDYTKKDGKEKGKSTKNIEVTKKQNHEGNSFYNKQVSIKQTKKRGRPPKQTNSTNVKGKGKKATTINVRRKRSLDDSNKRKRRKQESKSSSKSSRASLSSQSDVKRHRSKDKLEARAGKIKTHHRSTIESSSESEDESKSTESSSLSREISEKNRKYKNKKQKLSSNNVHFYKENKKKSERAKFKGSEEKTEKKKQISTEESESESRVSSQKYARRKRKEERKSTSENSSEKLEKRKVNKFKERHESKSTGEKTGKSFLKKEERKQSERVTQSGKISKELLESVSKEIRIKKRRDKNKKIFHRKDLESSESSRKSSSSGSRSTDEKSSSKSSDSKSQTKTKMSKKEIEKLKSEYKAKQRKLRRKRKKLLKKRLKRVNTTVTQVSKTTVKNKRTKSHNPILQDPDEPYTPATIVVRFTKDPRKYKKLPTRDVESIFDHKVDRYEDFIREYNFRHSCTPLGKKAIKKLEIIKESEFNQKQANRSEHQVLCKPGFESYDSDDFENNVERKHKPWEESVDVKPTETSIKLEGKITKKMPWDYKDEYTDEISSEDKKERSKQKLKKSEVNELSTNKKKNKNERAKKKNQSSSKHLIRETQKLKKGNKQEKDEESTDSTERRRSKSSNSKERDIKETQNSSEKISKTHKTDKIKRKNMHEKSKKRIHEEEKEQETGFKSSYNSEYQTKGLEKHLIKMQAPHKEVTEKPCTTHARTTERKDKSKIRKHKSQASGSCSSAEEVSHSKHSAQEDGPALDSSSDYSGEYSADLSEGPDEPDESASKLRREFWKMQEVRETRKPPRSEISVERTSESDRDITEGTTSITARRTTVRNKKAHQSKVLKRDKRTPQETTDANVINMNPLLMMTGLSAETTKKKRRKTTWFRRGKTPWRSQEITSSTLAPLVKRLRKKLEQIQSNTNRFIVNKVKNYTSVLEAKGLWHLWVSPNTTYTTPTPAIRRDIHLDFTVYQITDVDIYNQIAAKIIRDQGVPNKRKSQFRHSRQFFELLMSTTPDPAHLIIPNEMDVYWKQKEDLDMFLYRGQRDGRNRPGTIKYQKRMAAGKRWRMLAARRTGKIPVADEEGRERIVRERGEKRDRLRGRESGKERKDKENRDV